MANPQDGVFGDVTLNGETYRIDLPTYRVRDIVDFAPRASTPGGSIIHAELGLYQPYMKTDWRHGLGFMWETDAMGYIQTDGQVDTRHPGVAMLFTDFVNDSSAQAAQGFNSVQNYDEADAGDLDDRVLSWGSTGASIRSTDGTSWAALESTAEVKFILETQNYVHLFLDGLRPVVITKATGVADSDGGVGDSSLDYNWAIAHAGSIYCGKDDASLIFRATQEDLSDLIGDVSDGGSPETAGSYVVIGGNYETIGAIVFNGQLLVSRADGLFLIGGDLSAKRMLDFSNQVSTTNFRSMAVFNGYLMFPIRDTVYQWNGSTLVDVTPPMLTDTFPYTTYGRFDNFVAVNQFMFATARTNESTYEEHILCWDGVGWHKLLEPITDGSGEIVGMGYDAQNNFLWFSTDDATDTVNYVAFQDLSSFPFADFPTTGTHRITSSRMGMGFRRVTKSTPSIIVEGSNLSAARYLLVSYQLDGGTIFEWGDRNGSTGNNNGHVTSTGITTLTDPTGAGNSTIEYNFIQVHIDFVSDSSAQTPVLEGWTLRFIMRPATLYGHSMSIIAASNLKVGAARRGLRSVRDIYSAIDTARASTAPITLVDPFGVSVTGYVASTERVAVERHGRETRENFPNIESRILVNFVEVG